MVENLNVFVYQKQRRKLKSGHVVTCQINAGAAHNPPNSLVHVSRPLLLPEVTDSPLIAALRGSVYMRLIRQRPAPAD